MGADTLLTLLVVSSSCDQEVLRLSVASRSTDEFCAPAAVAANHRYLCRRLAVLRDHTGGNSTAVPVAAESRDRGRVCMWCMGRIELDQMAVNCDICDAGPFHVVHCRRHRRLEHGP